MSTTPHVEMSLTSATFTATTPHKSLYIPWFFELKLKVISGISPAQSTTFLPSTINQAPASMVWGECCQRLTSGTDVSIHTSHTDIFLLRKHFIHKGFIHVSFIHKGFIHLSFIQKGFIRTFSVKCSAHSFSLFLSHVNNLSIMYWQQFYAKGW